MPGAIVGADRDFGEASAPTAKTLSSRAVLADPHDGHLGFALAVIERWSCSNFFSHALQVYS
jgi:hypothetical protein